jgi:hypothetical protein
VQPSTKGNIYIYICVYIYISVRYTKRVLRGGGGRTKCGGPPVGNHVAPGEIKALQSTREVTPENTFTQRTVGTATHTHLSYLHTDC